MESEKISIREPMTGDIEEKTCCNKYVKIFIIVFIGLVLIAGVVFLFVLFLRDDEKGEDGNGNEDKVEPKYEFGLSMEELKKRTSKDYLGTISLLKANSPEYNNLQDGDKKALVHLLKAAMILEKIEYKIDDPHNTPFKEFLEEEIKKDNEQAKLTKILFDGQKGINALDRLSVEVNLAKGHKTLPGIGVYPEDLTQEEFHKILIKMLKENKTEEVKNITNQRSIVLRDGEYLKAVDYVEYFKEDFSKMADEFEAAANVSTDENFTQYLKLQAQALRTADPMLDALADKKWAELQDTPLELTLTRENYADEITGSFIKNDELTALLSEKNITPVTKDNLGLRVGIVNKEGTDFILRIKKFLPDLADRMPYKDEYEQDISEDSIKQTMVDADLVYLAGDVGAYRSGITLAENLPNDDKMSLTIEGGRRNVYHRQIRFGTNQTEIQNKLNEILDPEQHQYYDVEADHWFTIGHENTHTLGPKRVNDKLGEYSSIIEENKADMGGLAFVNLLTEKGYYTEEQRLKMIVTAVVDTFLKVEPTLAQAHRVRTVMQNYYLYQKGAYNITSDGKIHVNIENVVDAAYDMLTEIIRVQIDNVFEEGEEYVKKYFHWTEEMKIIGDKLQKLNSILNSVVENELADKLLSEN